MARRRRKQARAESGSGIRGARRQGELLPDEREAMTTEEGEDMDAGVEPIETVGSGRPRELVLFELVDEAGDPPKGDAARAPLASGVERALVPEADEPIQQPEAVDDPAPRRVLRRPVTFEEPTNPEAVLERLEAARALSPDDIGVLVNLGWTLGLLGRFEEAERELRKAQKLAPEDLAVRTGIGLLSFRRGLYQQAEGELRWVCEQDPEHGPAHFYRGEALNRLGRVDQALDVLERAVRLQPTNHRAYYTMGILYDRKNLPQQAAVMFRKARELQQR